MERSPTQEKRHNHSNYKTEDIQYIYFLVEYHKYFELVTPTDRPKSVRNRCVIEVFGGVFVLSRCFLDFSVGVGAFVIGLSQITSFFLL